MNTPSVLDFGAIGDGLTHPLSQRYCTLAEAQAVYPRVTALTQEIDWAATQKGIDLTKQGDTLAFPAQKFVISTPLVISGNKSISLVGGGIDVNGGTWLVGNVPNAPMVDIAIGFSNRWSIAGMGIWNGVATSGWGVRVNGGGTASSLRDGHVHAFKAIESTDGFGTLFQSVVVRGPAGAPVGSVGITLEGHGLISVCDVVGFDHGLRISGVTTDVLGCRLEVNRTAIIGGINRNGADFQLTRSLIAGNSFEANDVGIDIRHAASVVLQALGLQGSTNSPSKQSQVGIVCANCSCFLVQGLLATGSFSDVTIRLRPTMLKAKLAQVATSNDLPGGRRWDLTAPIGSLYPSGGPMMDLLLEQTDYAAN